MPGVRVKEGESFERAMRRFKKQCERAGILGEIRKREHYEKPSVRRKEKAAAARAAAIDTARMAFAPRRDLLRVPSSSISRRFVYSANSRTVRHRRTHSSSVFSQTKGSACLSSASSRGRSSPFKM